MINNLAIALILFANAAGFMALLHWMIHLNKALVRIHKFQQLQLDFNKLLVERKVNGSSDYIGKLKQ